MHSNSISKQAPATPPRQFRPGDRVRIFDALIGQYVWVEISDVLISMGRQKLQADSVGEFHFDEALVCGYQKGGGRG